ncbi:MAG: hypothetical protein GY953_43105 [bacterium]|nr:hypothetical protein [bacterium]
MFDLFRSRAKAVRYMLGAILVVVALSMVVTLIPGFVGASYSTNDNVIAEIGDEVVTVTDVLVELRQQMRQQEVPEEMRSMYIPLIIDRIISDRSVAYQARVMGFEITDAEVARTIQSLIPDLYPGGEFVGADIYGQYLQSNFQLSIPQFEANVRKQMLLVRLSSLSLEGTVVTQKEVEEEYRRRNETIILDYITVNPADYRSGVRVSREEVAEYYEGHKPNFMVPSERDVELIVIEESQVAKSATVPEEQLRTIYNQSLDRFRTGERVRARHILLMTSGKSDDEKKAARTEADELLNQLSSGADFAELAEANSDDTGTAASGGEMPWIERGQQGDPAFLAALFSLEPGQRSGVVEAEYGFHILEVLEQQKAQLQPFEAVKEQIASEATRQSIYERMQEVSDQAHKELTENPAAAAEVARGHGLRHVKVDRFSPGDSMPEIGDVADAVDLINSLAENGVTEVLTAGSDKLVIAAVTKIYPERQSELAAVEGQIRERLGTQKSIEVADEKVAELEKLVESAAGDLKQIARKAGLPVKTSPEFGRDGNVEGIGPASYVAEAFDAPEGRVVGPIKSYGQTFVCKVVEKTEADLSLMTTERQQIYNELKQRKAGMRRELFNDGILTRLIQEGKVKINERARSRLVNESRG